MGAGDHHRRCDEKDRPILEQRSSDDAANHDALASDDAAAIMADAQLQPLAPVEDIWAASEGYTPLRDMQTEDGGGLFSDGGSTTFYTSYPASFLTQMATNYEQQNDREEDEDDDASADESSIANLALMTLDNEYQRTVSYSMVRPPNERIEAEVVGTVDCFNSESVAFEAVDGGEQDAAPEPYAFTHYDKVLPEIDADAVRRAVQSIQLLNPKLKQNLQQWEKAQEQQANRQTMLAPRLHCIIPSTPLAAFRKQTAKAIDASANLSRSATIAEALRRFDALQSQWNVETTLRIHVIGCDHVECSSPERARTLFGPVVRWIGAYAEAPAHICIDLIGPNVPVAAASEWSPLDLLPTNSALSNLKPCLQSATLRCHVGLYEDWLSSSIESHPDLVMAFNAGVWGYAEWKSTIATIIQQKAKIPFVVTAYTIQEAEDDEAVIQELVSSSASGSSRCEWEAEPNPFASNKVRETHTAAEGRVYRENAAWQGWRL
jgi:hypothetical protein